MDVALYEIKYIITKINFANPNNGRVGRALDSYTSRSHSAKVALYKFGL